jgi:hypothetical protein
MSIKSRIRFRLFQVPDPIGTGFTTLLVCTVPVLYGRTKLPLEKKRIQSSKSGAGKSPKNNMLNQNRGSIFPHVTVRTVLSL